MKKTPWFPAEIKPIRIGIYQVRKSFGHCWARWDGRAWSHGSMRETVPPKEYFKMRAGAHPVFAWRGIQGDEHSCQIGASTYLIEFGEGPDRPGDDE
ncbi:hypothetical protein ACW910_24325 (plasmid) [Burkholderia ambifaria]